MKLQARMQASIESLNSYLDKIQILSAVSGPNCPVKKEEISQLHAGMENLRAAFHRIEQANSANQETEIQQATKVFYGIHSILRPEVLAVFVTLAKGYSLKFANNTSQPNAVH